MAGPFFLSKGILEIPNLERRVAHGGTKNEKINCSVSTACRAVCLFKLPSASVRKRRQSMDGPRARRLAWGLLCTQKLLGASGTPWFLSPTALPWTRTSPVFPRPGASGSAPPLVDR